MSTDTIGVETGQHGHNNGRLEHYRRIVRRLYLFIERLINRFTYCANQTINLFLIHQKHWH